MHDILRMGMNRGKWRIKHTDGSLSENLEISDLRNRAASNLLSANDKISENGRVWIKAHELVDLKMEWFIKDGDNDPVGPFNILAIPHLLVSKSISPHARLINKMSGKDLDMAEVLRSSMSTISKAPSTDTEKKEKKLDQPELFSDIKPTPVKQPPEPESSSQSAVAKKEETDKIIVSLEKECSSLRGELKKTKTDNTEKKKENEQMSLRIKDMLKEINKLSSNLANEQKKTESLQYQIEDLKNKTKPKQEKLTDEIYQLKTNLKAKTDEASAAAERLQKMISEMERYRKENDSALLELREIKSRKEAVEDEKQKEESEYTRTINELEEKLRSAESRSAILQEEISNLEQEYDQHEIDSKKLLEEKEIAIAAAETKVREVLEELNIQKKKNGELQESLSREEKDLNKAEKKQNTLVSQMERTVTEKENTIKDLNTRIQSLSSSLEEVSAERSSFSEQLTDLKNAHADMEKSWKEKESGLTEKIEKMTKEIALMRSNGESLKVQLQEEIESEKKEAKKSKSKSATMEKEIARLTRENVRMSNELNESKSKANMINGKLTQLRDKYDQLFAEHTETQNAIAEAASLREKLKSEGKYSAGLEEQIKTLKKENQSLNRASENIEQSKQTLMLRFEDVKKEQDSVNDNFEKERRELSDDLAASNSELVNARKQIHSLKQEISRYETVNMDLEQAVLKSSEREQKHVETIRKLKARLEKGEPGAVLISPEGQVISPRSLFKRVSAVILTAVICSVLAFKAGYRRAGEEEVNIQDSSPATVQDITPEETANSFVPVDEIIAAVEPAPPPPPAWPEINIPGVITDMRNDNLTLVFEQGVFISMTRLSEDARHQLRIFSKQIIPHVKNFHIAIHGHTDSLPVSSQASYNGNMELAKARADTVKKFLTEECGLPSESMISIAKGEKDAPFPNTDIQSRRKNRTVVICVSRKTESFDTP